MPTLPEKRSAFLRMSFVTTNAQQLQMNVMLKEKIKKRTVKKEKEKKERKLRRRRRRQKEGQTKITLLKD